MLTGDLESYVEEDGEEEISTGTITNITPIIQF